MQAGATPRVPSDIDQIFAITFNRFFVEMARIVTERFHGDLHLFLVLVAVANSSVAKIMNTNERIEKYKSLDVEIEEEYGFTRLLTIAQIVGLPRTTVRRKIAVLIALGYVEHSEGEGYRTIKGRMGKSPVINDILALEYILLGRLIGDLTKRGIMDRSGLRSAGQR